MPAVHRAYVDAVNEYVLVESTSGSLDCGSPPLSMSPKALERPSIGDRQVWIGVSQGAEVAPENVRAGHIREFGDSALVVLKPAPDSSLDFEAWDAGGGITGHEQERTEI